MIKNNNGATYVFVVIIVLIILFQLVLLLSLTINSRSLTLAHSENINRKIIANSSIEKAADMMSKTLNAAEEGTQSYTLPEALNKINSNLGKRFKSIDSSAYETKYEIIPDSNKADKTVYSVTVSIKYFSEYFEITSTVVETRKLTLSKYTSKVKALVRFDEAAQTLYIESMNTFM